LKIHAKAIKALEEALAKQEQDEPLEYWNAVEGWVKLDEVREHFNSVSCGTIYKNGGEGRVPLFLAQPKQEQGEPVAFDVWLQECESMTMAVRHGVKFLLMPEESAVRIGTAIQNTTPQQRT